MLDEGLLRPVSPERGHLVEALVQWRTVVRVVWTTS